MEKNNNKVKLQDLNADYAKSVAPCFENVYKNSLDPKLKKIVVCRYKCFELNKFKDNDIK